MSYADFYAVMEAVWTALAVVGMGLGLYLLRAERHDRAQTIAEDGRTGILSWALVTNETLKVIGQFLLFAAGVGSLATSNPSAPATPLGPVFIGLLVLFTALGVTQSAVLIYARKRIAHYPDAPMLAQQDTLLEVQRDMATSADVADLAQRATVSEHRADVAEHRADVSEGRADVAEKRADDAQARE